jgi:hypothetical protein
LPFDKGNRLGNDLPRRVGILLNVECVHTVWEAGDFEFMSALASLEHKFIDALIQLRSVLARTSDENCGETRRAILETP